MEDKIPSHVHKYIRWNPEMAVDRDWKDTPGRFGEDNRVMDLKEVKEWTEVADRESK